MKIGESELQKCKFLRRIRTKLKLLQYTLYEPNTTSIQHELRPEWYKIEITRTCSVAWEGWRLQLVYFVILKSSLAQLPLQAVDAHAVSERDHAGLSREIALHFFHHNPHHCYKGQFGEQNKNKTCGSFSWQDPVLVTSLIIVIQEIQINLPHPSLISFCFN